MSPTDTKRRLFICFSQLGKKVTKMCFNKGGILWRFVIKICLIKRSTEVIRPPVTKHYAGPSYVWILIRRPLVQQQHNWWALVMMIFKDASTRVICTTIVCLQCLIHESRACCWYPEKKSIDIFLISIQKHTLCVLIRSASLRCF